MSRPTVTVSITVRADSEVEAGAAALLVLATMYRSSVDAARLLRCAPDPWLPAGPNALRPEGGPQPQGWRVRFLLPTLTLEEVLGE